MYVYVLFIDDDAMHCNNALQQFLCQSNITCNVAETVNILPLCRFYLIHVCIAVECQFV